MQILDIHSNEVVTLLKRGEIGVLPTDTIYGIHASAFSKEAIERMYEIRLRDKNKPFIVLLHHIGDLSQFGITLSAQQKELLSVLWQQVVSIVLPVSNSELEYLTRGTGSIAFRIPQHESLRELLAKTGPLVSTSVNRQGEEPAETIEEIHTTFGNEITFAIDEGRKRSLPSTLVTFEGNNVRIIRQGSAVIPAEYLVK